VRYRHKNSKTLQITKRKYVATGLLLFVAMGGLFFGQFTPLFPDAVTNADPANPADASFINNPAADLPACKGQSECFAFSIDTRLTSDGATTGTTTTFSIPTSGNVNNTGNSYNWIIDWGDQSTEQTVSGTSSRWSDGIPHDYASSGGAKQYQITVRPNNPTDVGWFNAFGLYSDNTSSNMAKFRSIDTPLTDNMRTAGATFRFAFMFNGAVNGLGIPTGLFAKLSVAGASDMSSLFWRTFFRFAENATDAIIPTDLFAFVDTSNATNLSAIFYGTFESYATNSTASVIPANLFNSIKTGKATNMESMFERTFLSVAAKSTTATIPASLFSTIDTSNVTNFNRMFQYTFAYCAQNATAATIPAGLFSPIDTGKASSTDSMFSRTFYRYAQNSTSGTIPANLFDSINTGNAVNTSGMFYRTFYYYAQNSTAAAIPADLFDSLNTGNAVNTSTMFSGTFEYFGRLSKAATIPAGLFKSLDTGKATDVSGMFSDTFDSYAYYSSIATIPADLFSSINTSSVTNISYMFSNTFRSYGAFSSAVVIPAGLFSSIHTDNVTNFSRMFRGTFSGLSRSSTTVTIPADLFKSINTSNAIDMDSMFSETFASFANNSYVATIPAGLFSSIDTSKATNLSAMFLSTFSNYARNSTAATIPIGLFDSINTNKATDISYMFMTTFRTYGFGSYVATIPTDLFKSIDTSKATNLKYVFDETFLGYGRRQADFIANGSVVGTQGTYYSPYATKIGNSGTPSDKPVVAAGDVVYPTYSADVRTINAPTNTSYANYIWFTKDGTSCAAANPTPDCGVQNTSSRVTFPNSTFWTPSTPTEIGSLNFYGRLPALPTVTAVSPGKGVSDVSGQVITITGTNFTGTTAVTVGGENCLSFTVTSATQIYCTLPTFPAASAGVKDVLVTSADATSPTSPSAQYEVIAAYITLATDGNVPITANPGKFSSGQSITTVSTNYPKGYQLSMKAVSANLTKSTTPTDVIPTLPGYSAIVPASAGVVSNIIGKTPFWAYRVNNLGNFGATTNRETNATSTAYPWATVPTTDSLIRIGTVTDDLSTNTPQTTDIWFGASPTGHNVSGEYFVQVVYTVAADV
jgi:glutathionyl-hydroquinone reductase